MATYDYESADFLPPFFDKMGLDRCSDSERKLLAAILRKKSLTQPDLCKTSGLAQQSVSRHTIKMVEKGLIINEVQPNRGRRGPPSSRISLNPHFGYTMGIAMMTDAISVALLDFAGNVVDQESRKIHLMNQENFVGQYKEIEGNLLTEHGIKRSSLLGIGIGISGYSLGGRSRFNTPKGLGDWALVEIDEVLGEYLELPVWVENDANAAAIGENLVGIGRRYEDFVYIYIDAGIGGGVILNHELLKGPHNNGGEVGLLLPADQEYPVPTLLLLKEMLEHDGFVFDDISKMIDNFDIEWNSIDQWVSKCSKSLSLICSSLAAILDTRAIVFGGRIPDELSQKLVSRIDIFDDKRRSEPRPKPRLLTTQVKGNACAIGAAMLPFNRLFFSS